MASRICEGREEGRGRGGGFKHEGVNGVKKGRKRKKRYTSI